MHVVQFSPRWKNRAGLAGAIVLGALLVVAAVAKAFDPLVFAQEIRNERLDFWLSANAVMLVALALEAGLGLALLSGLRGPRILIPAALLVAFFLFLTGRNYYLGLIGERDPSRSCGCFGTLLNRTAAEAFWQDLLILGLPLILAFWGRPRQVEKGVELRLSLAALGAAALVVFVITGPGLPLDHDPPVAAAEAIAAFQPAAGYQLVVEDIPVPARIYHSESDLQFLILSEALSAPVLLDLRRQSVLILERQSVAETSGGLAAPGGTRTAAGQFEITSEGLRFVLDGKTIQMR